MASWVLSVSSHCLLQKAAQIPVTTPLRFQLLGSVVFLVAKYRAILGSHINPEHLVQTVSLPTVKGIATYLPKCALDRDTGKHPTPLSEEEKEKRAF